MRFQLPPCWLRVPLAFMKPKTLLADSETPDGLLMALYTHDGDYSISLKGQELMHSKASASELLLGELGVADLDASAANRVLIGGLGLGFTLRAVLAGLGADAAVDVVELLPAVVAWNRDFLADLNGALLEDARVRVVEADVAAVIYKGSSQSYDRILLDTDNGPTSMVQASNDSLYSAQGLDAIRRLLRPKGRVVFWSASEDVAFQQRMQQVGFRVRAVPAKVHERAKRAAYILYVGYL